MLLLYNIWYKENKYNEKPAMIFVSFILTEGVRLDINLFPLAFPMFLCVLFMVVLCPCPLVVSLLFVFVNFLLFSFLLSYFAFFGQRLFSFMMFMRSFRVFVEFLWFESFVFTVMTSRLFGLTFGSFMIVISPMLLVLFGVRQCFGTFSFIFLDIHPFICLTMCFQSQGQQGC